LVEDLYRTPYDDRHPSKQVALNNVNEKDIVLGGIVCIFMIDRT